MSFCEQLQKRRKELGLSRTELAARLGVSPSAVGNYETGVSAPKEEVLLRLFDALEVDPNYLYRGSFRHHTVFILTGSFSRPFPFQTNRLGRYTDTCFSSIAAVPDIHSRRR